MRVRAAADSTFQKVRNERQEIGFTLFDDGLCKLDVIESQFPPHGDRVVGWFELSRYRWHEECGGTVVPFREFRAFVHYNRELIRKVAEFGRFPDPSAERDSAAFSNFLALQWAAEGFEA